MNITKSILKNKNIEIIADDNTLINNDKLKELVAKNISTLAKLGVKKKNNVAIVLSNSIDFVACFLSVINVSVSAPLNPNYTEGEFDFYFNDLKPKIMITNLERDHPALKSAEKKNIRVIEIKNGILVEPIKRVKKNNVFASYNDTALILHTSGTTSRPKMVPLTHKNMLASSRNIIETLNLSKKDKNIILMPSFHIHGIVASILAPLIADGKIVVLPSFNALNFFKSVKTHSPTWFTGVPTMLQAILDRSSKNSDVLSSNSLRFIRSSSASLPVSTLKKLEKVFKVPVIESYGMTEASHQMTSNLLPPKKRKAGSVGVSTGIKLKIVDENFRSLKKNNIGEILIKGKSILKKYIAKEKVNLSSFKSNWFRTGDLGYMDKDNYLYIVGRIKEIINRGGEKISPKEVDEVFMGNKKINKAVSFAIKHPKLGEEIGLAVVLNKNTKCTTNELKDYASNKLAKFKIPKQIFFLDEIPLGATGKVQRIGLAKKLGLED